MNNPRDLKAGEAALIRKKDRLPRTIAKVVIGIAAGITTFVLLLALLDTSDAPPEAEPTRDASANTS